MFIKRLYYAVRFYPSLFIQIVFPVLFTGIGLLVIILNPNSDDPPRALFMSNTGLDSRNTTVFYAELDGFTMNFSVRYEENKFFIKPLSHEKVLSYDSQWQTTTAILKISHYMGIYVWLCLLLILRL